MRLSPLVRWSARAAAGLLLAALIVFPAEASGKRNPGIMPIKSKPFGKSYGDWSAEWWKWAFSIPAAQNPLLDSTGEFGDVGQTGKVWFLAGTFGGAAERTLEVPAGKALFFPILNSVWWAPNDLGTAAAFAESIGLDPDEMTDEELIRLVATSDLDPDAELTLTVDGVEFKDLTRYRAESRPFVIEDTDLLDDLGLPIDEDNFAISSGYWVMLRPLPPGEHVIRFTAKAETGVSGIPFEVDVTYYLTVKAGKK